jgi:hypothetical protein
MYIHTYTYIIIYVYYILCIHYIYIYIIYIPRYIRIVDPFRVPSWVPPPGTRTVQSWPLESSTRVAYPAPGSRKFSPVPTQSRKGALAGCSIWIYLYTWYILDISWYWRSRCDTKLSDYGLGCNLKGVSALPRPTNWTTDPSHALG